MDASNPGSAHDSSVWQNHPLSQHLMELSTNGEQGFLLGNCYLFSNVPNHIAFNTFIR